MTIRLLIAAALLVFCGVTTATAQTAQEVMLTQAQVLNDIALAEEAYSRIHPGYTRYRSPDEMRAAWNRLRDTAENGLSVGNFYLGLQQVLVEMRCDHTKAELPEALRQERLTQPVYLSFRWRWLEGRAFVTHPGKNRALTAGDEILKIDDRPIADWVEDLIRYIPYDGLTTWSRNSGISESLEFMGGAVDHFGSLTQWPAATAKLLISNADGSQQIVSSDRIAYKAWRTLQSETGPASNFKDAVRFERIGDRSALLSIDTFVNYRSPVKPDTLYAPIFRALRAEGRTNLILDLRNNGGGSSDAQMGLLAYLIQQRRALYSDMRVATLNMDGLREHLSTWDKRALKPNRLGFKKNDDGTYSMRTFVDDDLKKIRPKKDAFHGQLILLISHDNSSASATIATFLKAHRNAVLIGEATGGSAEGPTAGLLFTLTLPESDIRTRVPFIRHYTNVPGFEYGLGMSPDIQALQTVSTLRNGKDTALAAALSFIQDISPDSPNKE